MRFTAYLQKTFKENLREWKITILALLFGPFFVYMMYAYFGTTNPSYTLLVMNQDRAVTFSGSRLNAGDNLLAEWKKAAYPDGKRIFKVQEITDLETAKKELKSRDADLLLIVPSDFSDRLRSFMEKKAGAVPSLINYGDPGHTRYLAAASFADYISFSFISALTRVDLPLNVDFQPISRGHSLNEFDLYVPALLVLAIIMVLFTAAASLIKEVDKGTMARLMLSKLTTLEFIGAISVNQMLIGLAALGLTFLAALHVGYATSGSVFLFLCVGLLSSLSVIAISLLVAAIIKTIFELLTVGVFPFFILMFFSDCMFPLPRIALFSLAGHPFYANDILPTALTVKAFNKILNFNAGFNDLIFELSGILILTAIYFLLGIWFFRYRHMRVR
ncbi:MAG: ABC transporter permease [Desulfobacteraceae bacterium]|nr:MAG: ABC transporter permease [Desulfobacteraceae bacterium]